MDTKCFGYAFSIERVDSIFEVSFCLIYRTDEGV